MIRVEFQEPVPENTADYQVAAVLVVDADGTYRFEGSESAVPVDVPVPVADETGKFVASVTLAQDPSYWARNIDLALRTPYLVPVITHDDEAAAGENA
ncbi:hypothetical protein [Nocardioides limicola]|uniref:hypothetical protein n=1 Tax=Nocardioides limicola TaxID=2803368 RepID=UPI00193BC181|nr:hypothetical protein [Nocardioides sp. DJM-14]